MATPAPPVDRSLRVRPGQFVDEETPKSAVVLHHTADGSPRASLSWWNEDPQRIATAYVIGRDGTVHEVFPPECWAYHTGTGSRFDGRAIGIELTNWGWLTKKGGRYLNWRGGEVHPDDVVEHNWRGFRYWQRYPEAQIEATIQLVRYLVDRFGIDPDVAPEDRQATDTDRWRGWLGVLAHYHVRTDKTDVHPGFPWDRLTAAVEGPADGAPARPPRVVIEPIPVLPPDLLDEAGRPVLRSTTPGPVEHAEVIRSNADHLGDLVELGRHLPAAAAVVRAARRGRWAEAARSAWRIVRDVRAAR